MFDSDLHSNSRESRGGSAFLSLSNAVTVTRRRQNAECNPDTIQIAWVTVTPSSRMNRLVAVAVSGGGVEAFPVPQHLHSSRDSFNQRH